MKGTDRCVIRHFVCDEAFVEPCAQCGLFIEAPGDWLANLRSAPSLAERDRSLLTALLVRESHLNNSIPPCAISNINVIVSRKLFSDPRLSPYVLLISYFCHDVQLSARFLYSQSLLLFNPSFTAKLINSSSSSQTRLFIALSLLFDSKPKST